MMSSTQDPPYGLIKRTTSYRLHGDAQSISLKFKQYFSIKLCVMLYPPCKSAEDVATAEMEPKWNLQQVVECWFSLKTIMPPMCHCYFVL